MMCRTLARAPRLGVDRTSPRRGWDVGRTIRAAAVLVASLALAACGSVAASPSREQVKAQHDADLYGIEQIEVTWHKSASTHDLDLMMSLWADNATFTVGTATYSGKADIRNFFATKAAPFQAGNNWVSETPAYKVRATVAGDKGTLYFECHYVDAATKLVKSVVGADQNVAKVNGQWLITSSVSASPVLAP
jgi:ketosteroid isomerase-like protein